MYRTHADALLFRALHFSRAPVGGSSPPPVPLESAPVAAPTSSSSAAASASLAMPPPSSPIPPSSSSSASRRLGHLSPPKPPPASVSQVVCLPYSIWNNMHKFACTMAAADPGQSGFLPTAAKVSPNRDILEMLHNLEKIYNINTEKNDFFRLRAVKNVLSFIEKYPIRIFSERDLLHALDVYPNYCSLDRTGSIYQNIKETIEGGPNAVKFIHKRLELAKVLERSRTDLRRLHGIGEKMAEKLLGEWGITSVDMLGERLGAEAEERARLLAGSERQFRAFNPSAPPEIARKLCEAQMKKSNSYLVDLLHDDTLACLPYVDELEQRIPRAEVEEIIAVVHACAEEVYGRGEVRVVCCGSYRRGKASSGDVDILISPVNGADNVALHLEPLIQRLYAVGLMRRTLACGNDINDDDRVATPAWKGPPIPMEVRRPLGPNPLMRETNTAKHFDAPLSVSSEELRSWTVVLANRVQDEVVSRDAWRSAARYNGGGGAGSGGAVGGEKRPRTEGAASSATAAAGSSKSAKVSSVALNGDDGGEHASPSSSPLLSSLPSSPSALAVDEIELLQEGAGGSFPMASGGKDSKGQLKFAQQWANGPCIRLDYSKVPWMGRLKYNTESFMGLARLPSPSEAAYAGAGSGGGGGAAAAAAAAPKTAAAPAGTSCGGGATTSEPRRLMRRLDIKSYVRSIFPYAIQYFTGSDHFNRSMRCLVHRCGWSLSDQGLRPVHRNEDGVIDEGGLSVVAHTEEDVFRLCGLPYVPPEKRDV